MERLRMGGAALFDGILFANFLMCLADPNIHRCTSTVRQAGIAICIRQTIKLSKTFLVWDSSRARIVAAGGGEAWWTKRRYDVVSISRQPVWVSNNVFTFGRNLGKHLGLESFMQAATCIHGFVGRRLCVEWARSVRDSTPHGLICLLPVQLSTVVVMSVRSGQCIWFLIDLDLGFRKSMFGLRILHEPRLEDGNPGCSTDDRITTGDPIADAAQAGDTIKATGRTSESTLITPNRAMMQQAGGLRDDAEPSRVATPRAFPCANGALCCSTRCFRWDLM